MTDARTLLSEDTESLAGQLNPASILQIGDCDLAMFAGYLSAHPDTGFTCLSPEQAMTELATLDRHELGLVQNTLEVLDKESAGILIARLRDLLCPHLFIAVELGQAWQLNDLLAYGMVLHARPHPEADHPLHIFRFEIDDYKITPEWLNPKHWANPHHWDKHFW